MWFLIRSLAAKCVTVSNGSLVVTANEPQRYRLTKIPEQLQQATSTNVARKLTVKKLYSICRKAGNNSPYSKSYTANTKRLL